MKNLNLIFIILLFFCMNLAHDVVNKNENNRTKMYKRKATREDRKSHYMRRLQLNKTLSPEAAEMKKALETNQPVLNDNPEDVPQEESILNGNNIGMVLGATGVGLAFLDREAQQRKLSETLGLVKTQFYRAQVLSQRNKDLYRNMDSILVDLEDKIEDLGDDVYQKLSDFDNSVKSKLSGRTYMPTFSSLH